MPLVRGAVYVIDVEVPHRGGGVEIRPKYTVILQDASVMDDNAARVAYVLCGTDNTGPDGPRVHEAQLGPEDGFPHSTIVDGRWVFTSSRTVFDETRYAGFTLRPERMRLVDYAVFCGLQLGPWGD